ncbi:MAG: hypothetical protein CM15mV8_0950 [Caudoviricetes sp.]|nr:MAG: hypothetical protein CM15mV8_0950 [Caudoviricetes sp.]
MLDKVQSVHFKISRWWGNNLLVASFRSRNAFEQTTTTSQQVDGSTSVGDTTITVDSDATNYINVGDIIEFSSTVVELISLLEKI